MTDQPKHDDGGQDIRPHTGGRLNHPWPKPNDADRRGGWSIAFSFLNTVEGEVESLGEDISLEQIEAVLCSPSVIAAMIAEKRRREGSKP